MSVGQDLYTWLAAEGSITALVSTRIYPQVLPQGTTVPALAYEAEAANSVRTLGNDSSSNQAELSVRVWSDRMLEAWDIADTIRAALDEFSGVFGAATADIVQFETQFDLPPDEDTNRRGVEQRYRVTYS